MVPSYKLLAPRSGHLAEPLGNNDNGNMNSDTTPPEAVRRNRIVFVHMKVYDTDNVLLQSTEDEGPFAYLHGHNNLIDKLETALDGLLPGEKCEVEISPAEGYGERIEEATIEVPRETLAEGMHVEIGTQVAANGPDGQMEFTVIAFNDDEVTLDANHPLAGKQLRFELQIETVRLAHKDEVKHGRPHPAGHHLMVDDSSFEGDPESV